MLLNTIYCLVGVLQDWGRGQPSLPGKLRRFTERGMGTGSPRGSGVSTWRKPTRREAGTCLAVYE